MKVTVTRYGVKMATYENPYMFALHVAAMDDDAMMNVFPTEVGATIVTINRKIIVKRDNSDIVYSFETVRELSAIARSIVIGYYKIPDTYWNFQYCHTLRIAAIVADCGKIDGSQYRSELSAIAARNMYFRDYA